MTQRQLRSPTEFFIIMCAVRMLHPEMLTGAVTLRPHFMIIYSTFPGFLQHKTSIHTYSCGIHLTAHHPNQGAKISTFT